MMKRKILSGLLGLSMLGAAGSANAFLFNAASFDLNGAAMTISGLGTGPAGFVVALDLSTPFGSSSMTSDLGGMVAGGSVSANAALVVDGMIGLDNPATPALDFSRTYNDRTAFTGTTTTTLNTLIGPGALPGVLDTTTSDFSGTMTVSYTGAFSSFPLLGIGGPGAGTMTIAFGFTDATGPVTDTLVMTIVETGLTGWTGMEAALLNLDGLGGGPLDGSVSAIVYAGQSIVPGTCGAAGCTQNSSGLLTVTAVPEPASLALLGLGIIGLGLTRRRRA